MARLLRWPVLLRRILRPLSACAVFLVAFGPARGATCSIASAAAGCSGAFASSYTCSIAGGISQNHLSAVPMFTNQDATTFFSAPTDSGSNTYTSNTAVYQSANGIGLAIGAAPTGTAISAGGTVTVNMANSSNGAGNFVIDCTSVAASSIVDTGVTATLNTTMISPSITAAGAVTQTDIVICAFWVQTGGGTFSAYGAGYTGLDNGHTWNSYSAYDVIEYKEYTSGTPSCSFTSTSNVNVVGILIAYKEAGGAVSHGLFQPSRLNGITTGGPFFANPVTFSGIWAALPAFFWRKRFAWSPLIQLAVCPRSRLDRLVTAWLVRAELPAPQVCRLAYSQES